MFSKMYSSVARLNKMSFDYEIKTSTAPPFDWVSHGGHLVAAEKSLLDLAIIYFIFKMQKYSFQVKESLGLILRILHVCVKWLHSFPQYLFHRNAF